MIRSLIVVVALVAGAVLCGSLRAQTPAQPGKPTRKSAVQAAVKRTDKPTQSSPAEKQAKVASDAPMSIFNDKLRRFKFHIEHALATSDEAEAFVQRYAGGDNPKIIGAYADPETNSLIVIAGPEAEQAIRLSLATALVQTQGLEPLSMVAQRRSLLARRRGLLEEMAHLEVMLVEVKGTSAAEKVQQRLDAFEKELTIVERQVEVVDKYQQRLDDSRFQERPDRRADSPRRGR